MKIKTGKGTIELTVLIAIWSISAITSLPGLAIAPILGKLEGVFPKASDLEIQQLTSLPSLLIIPFVLLAGFLSVRRNKVALLCVGLSIFLLCGASYFLARSMQSLIIISSLLGVGAGMVIPLSTGLIADGFTGRYRTRQLGYSSAINNVTLVIATFVSGWLATVHWHLPFLVYLLPAISLALILLVRKRLPQAGVVVDVTSPTPPPQDRFSPAQRRAIAKLMGLYFLVTEIVLVIVYDLPFLLEHHGIKSAVSGGLISLFFLSIMLPGLFLDRILRWLGGAVAFVSFLALSVGLLLIAVSSLPWLLGIGVALCGLGYGVIQPVVYDRASGSAPRSRMTLALALVMSVNYLSILLTPVLVAFFKKILGSVSDDFPFVFHLLIAIPFTVAFFVRRGRAVV